MKRITPPLVLGLLAASLPAHAFLNLGDKEVDTKALTALATDALDNQAQQSPLVNMLTESLDVSPTQAAGGASALLSLANSQLGSEQNSELSSLIPGMSQLTGSNGLTDMITNMAGVNQAFEKLGLDPALISQFTPLLLKYLTSQGATEGLLGSLSSLWQ